MLKQIVVALLLGTGLAMAASDSDNRGGRGRRKPESGAEFVKRLDKNGDNKVSKTEFDGPSEHFTKFDKNSDGYISADEVPSGPPPRRNNDSNSNSDR
jgi:hypothetical protein